jgi:pimeloyl-ACP methyl ester carboxylesterase
VNELPLESIQVEARGLSFPALACGEGPLVLCLHGFPDTHYSFRHQLRAFATVGYRAVAPALRGYAPSCLGKLEDSHALEAARDAVAIVEALGETRAHLVGHDWGAVSLYLAAALAPDRWLSLTALAIPHPLGILKQLPGVPTQLKNSWYMALFQLPVAERAVVARDFALIEQLWRTWSPGYHAGSEELTRVKRAFHEPAVLRASLQYYRSMLALTGGPAREALALLKRPLSAPLLALAGSDDGCIDRRMFALAMEATRGSGVVCEELQALGHFMHLEDPARLNARILAWLAAPGA